MYATADTTQLKHINIENGLPTNKAYSIIQDRHGYIWFATENGVVKYNGYTFRVFNVKDGLPSNDVWKLFEDNRGRIWLGCYANEIGYIKDDKYYAIKLNGKESIKVYTICVLEDKVLIHYDVAMNMGLLAIYTDGKVVNARLPRDISFANLSADGTILAASANDGTIKKYIVKGSSVQIERLCTYDSTMHNGSRFFFEGGDFLYNVTLGMDNINLKNIRNCRTTNIYLNGLGTLKEESIKMCDLSYNNKYECNGTIVYGKNGCYYFTKNFDTVHVINYKDYFNNAPIIYNTLTDSFRNKWFVTHKGIYTIPTNVLKLRNNKTNEGGVECRFVGSLSNGALCWWNNESGYFYITDTKDNIISRIHFPSKFLAFVEKENDKLLVAVSGKIGLFELDINKQKLLPFIDNKTIILKSKRLQQYKNVLEKIDDHNHTAVMKKEFNSFSWANMKSIRKHDSVKYVYRGATTIGSFIAKGDTIIADIKNYERYMTMLYDAYYGCYMYANAGNVLFETENDKQYFIDERMLKNHSVSSIINLLSDNKGNIIIHASNGVFIANPEQRKFYKLSLNANVADAKLYIHEDCLYVATIYGMYYIKCIGKLYTTPKLQLFGLTRYYNAVYDFFINNNGVVYLNTDKGMYNIDIKALDTITNDMPVVMSLMLSVPYYKPIQLGDTIKLSKQDIAIRFDAINYYGKGGRVYRYKITGLTDWAETNTGEVFLEGMKPERYYKVQCIANDDVWSTALNTFYIYKEPYWWQSAKYIRIFWIAGTLLFGLLVFGIVLTTRYYVNKMNEKKGRLLELELRALYSQINPHFIFNTLSSALFFINKKNFDEAYNHVSKFSKLLRSYLNSSQERYVTLSHEISMLRNYIELQQIRFEEKFDYYITVDNKIPSENIKIPSLLLQPLVENAINHGLFHLKQKGCLLINFRQGKDSNEMVCIIDDNGIGRQRAAEIKKESTTQYTSYGTKLTRKLIDIFREYEHMNIYLEYIDKQLPDRGTIVQLTIRNLKYDA